MSKSNFYKTTLRLDKETYDKLNKIAQSRNESLASVIRETIEKGLALDWVDENTNLIAQIVRQQMEIVIKPHIERLAALSSKTGHMASTATFLNVQAFMDLVPLERKKDVRILYEKARKKAVEYMRTRTEDWKGIDE